MLLLYGLLIWRALRILTMSKDLFGSLVAGGVAAMLMFQVFVNVGMTIGIMPITGVTLPLMSYGGSSVITTLLAVGLLQSIYVQARASAGTEGPRAALDTYERPSSPMSRRAIPDRQLWMRRRGFSSGLAPAPGASARPSIPKDWITLKKQVLVSVDRAETRVALLEAAGSPSVSPRSAATDRRSPSSRKRASGALRDGLSHS